MTAEDRDDLTPHEREAQNLTDDVEDIGDTSGLDLDGDGIPDDLDVGDLDDLVAAAPEEPDDDFDPASPEEGD